MKTVKAGWNKCDTVITYHEAAQQYPESNEETEQLIRADMHQSGFDRRFPIIISQDGLLVAGRCRLKCAKAEKIDFFVVKLGKGEDPYEVAQRENEQRNHYNQEALDRLRHQRNERILKASANGQPVREIAKDEKISTTRVQQILQESHLPGRNCTAPVQLPPELSGIAISPKLLPKILELSKAKQKDLARLVAKYGDVRKCYDMVMDQREPGDEDEKTEEPKLPKSVANAMADTWHAECAAALASMRKQVKTNINWSEWLSKEVLDHLKAAEEYFLAAMPRKLCDACKGFQSVGKLKCARCRGCGYLASQA